VNKKSRVRKLVCEALENRTLLASDWQNPGQLLDVNHDLKVSPLDALITINRLNSRVERTLPLRLTGSTEPYYDIDGNGAHNPLDILLVINALNSRKPTIGVELLKDSGLGPGASTDRITSDSNHGLVSSVPNGTETVKHCLPSLLSQSRIRKPR